MAAINIISEEKLRAICEVLGDTSEGLTGGEIGKLLSDSEIEDPYPGITKRERLYEALQARQERDRCANNVLMFIQRAMAPVRYVGRHAVFENRRARLNLVLAFAGYTVTEDGSLGIAKPATTLDEAQERAGRLRALLGQRGTIHPDVLRACRQEVVADNYFHAVLEATKSLSVKIRQRTGLTGDGASLVDAAFGFKNSTPYLAINSLRTE